MDVTNIPKTLQLPGIEYHVVSVDDSVLANLKNHFQSTAEFIQKAKSSVKRYNLNCLAQFRE